MPETYTNITEAKIETEIFEITIPPSLEDATEVLESLRTALAELKRNPGMESSKLHWAILWKTKALSQICETKKKAPFQRPSSLAKWSKVLEDIDSLEKELASIITREKIKFAYSSEDVPE
ncbi:MAG: hypothetical protein WCV72_01105 [Patescibacteria group bacterium]